MKTITPRVVDHLSRLTEDELFRQLLVKEKIRKTSARKIQLDLKNPPPSLARLAQVFADADVQQPG